MPNPSATIAYRLKVSLRHIYPMIWRRLLAPSDLTLYGLHRSVQIAFGWEDYHLHAFTVRGGATARNGPAGGTTSMAARGESWRWPTCHCGCARSSCTSTTSVTSGSTKFVSRAEREPTLRNRIPSVPAKGGAGPPEDIGGPDGYDRLLERLEDVRLERIYGTYQSIDLDNEEGSKENEWALAARNGFDGFEDPLLRYDPSAFDRRAVNAELKREFVPGPGEGCANAITCCAAVRDATRSART